MVFTCNDDMSCETFSSVTAIYPSIHPFIFFRLQQEW